MIFEKIVNELKDVKVKNIEQFKETEVRLKGYTKENKEFCIRSSEAYGEIIGRIPQIQRVLKDYFDSPVISVFFCRGFDDVLVNKVLNDYEFVAFLVEAHLINRTLILDEKSAGQFKLRLYSAILDYAEYKKMLS